MESAFGTVHQQCHVMISYQDVALDVKVGLSNSGSNGAGPSNAK